MSYCSLTLKKVCNELNNLSQGRITKIVQENPNTIILQIYKNENYNLKIDISSSSYSMYLTKQNPNSNINSSFLDSLRKNLINCKINHIYTLSFDRIAYIDLICFDDFDELKELRLVIELMGKHSNIILLDENEYIIESLRHLKKDENPLSRDIFPKVKYIRPSNSKKEINDISQKEFLNIAKLSDDLIANITNNIEGICKDFILAYFLNTNSDLLDKKDINNKNIALANDNIINNLYSYILNSTNNIENLNIANFKLDNYSFYSPYLTKNSSSVFYANSFLDNYYTQKLNNSLFTQKKNNIAKKLNTYIKKYNLRLKSMNNKLSQSSKKEQYKDFGNIILSNLYNLSPNQKQKEICVFSYIENKDIVIKLNEKYTIKENADLFFKKYNKLKNQEIIVSIQKNEVITILKYLDSILFSLENSKSIDELQLLENEITEFEIKYNLKQIKNKKQNTKNTKNNKINLDKISQKVNGYNVLVGRNNLENDYLTLKYAKKTDIWFHVKDFHGTHVILQKHFPDEQIDESIIKEVAIICARHSKAKNSSNVPVDYCPVKFVKKPNGSNPGYVIYSNNKTVYVTP